MVESSRVSEMPLSVLTANQVAERCFLHEALYWVALTRFPLASLLEDGEDGREYDKWVDGIKPPYALDTVSRDECLFAGIPINPAWEAEQSFTRHFQPDELERWIARESDEVRKKGFQLSLAKAIAYYKDLEAWNSMFESYLDLHAARLFVALRQGGVVATGKRLPKRSLQQLLKQAAVDESQTWPITNTKPEKARIGAPDWYCIDRDAIPKEFWISKEIDWRSCCASGADSAFALILIETSELFRAFPIPQMRNVKQVSQMGNGYVLFDDEGNAVSPAVVLKGRPAFDWDEFNIEMARRARDGTLPVKQEALIVDMQAWCRIRWGRDVARSTLLQKIKPYYDALMRPSES
jgi:hypothetical protein